MSSLQDFVAALGCKTVAHSAYKKLAKLYSDWLSEQKNTEWASLEWAEILDKSVGEPILACGVLESFAWKAVRSGESGL